MAGYTEVEILIQTLKCLALKTMDYGFILWLLCITMSQSVVTITIPPPPGQIFKICQILESREFCFIKISGPKAFLIPFNTFYTFPPLSRYLLLSYPINMYKFMGIYMKIQLICIRYVGQMPCLSQIPGQDINLSQMPQGCLGGDCNAWN